MDFAFETDDGEPADDFAEFVNGKSRGGKNTRIPIALSENPKALCDVTPKIIQDQSIGEDRHLKLP
jgi:hypothetical protein